MADPRHDPLLHRLDGLMAPGDARPLPTPVVAALRRRRRSVAALRAGVAAGAIAVAASIAVVSLRSPVIAPEPVLPHDRGLASLVRAEPLPTAASLLQHYVRGEDTPALPLWSPSDEFRAGDGLWAGPERVAELAGGV